MTEALLSVERLRTYFFTKAGVCKAVDDVSFTVDAGEVTLRKLSSLLVFVSCVLADYTRTIHETTPNRTNKPLRVASWIVLHGKPISQNQEIKTRPQTE